MLPSSVFMLSFNLASMKSDTRSFAFDSNITASVNIGLAGIFSTSCMALYIANSDVSYKSSLALRGKLFIIQSFKFLKYFYKTFVVIIPAASFHTSMVAIFIGGCIIGGATIFRVFVKSHENKSLVAKSYACIHTPA